MKQQLDDAEPLNQCPAATCLFCPNGMLPAVSAKGIGKKTTGMGHASLNADKVVTIALIANVTHQSRSTSRDGRREDANTHSTKAEMLRTTLILRCLTTTLRPQWMLR